MYSAVPATSLAYTAKISTLSYQIPIAKLKPSQQMPCGMNGPAVISTHDCCRYETYYALVETLFVSDTKY